MSVRYLTIYRDSYFDDSSRASCFPEEEREKGWRNGFHNRRLFVSTPKNRTIEK